MKFSLFHLPTFFPQFHPSEAQFYQEMLEETARAEALGFHGVWLAEHRQGRAPRVHGETTTPLCGEIAETMMDRIDRHAHP